MQQPHFMLNLSGTIICAYTANRLRAGALPQSRWSIRFGVSTIFNCPSESFACGRPQESRPGLCAVPISDLGFAAMPREEPARLDFPDLNSYTETRNSRLR